MVNYGSLIILVLASNYKTMSKRQLTSAVQRELEILNKRIDQKILRGLSYATEAKRHRMLVDRLISLNRHGEQSFLSRITSIFHISKFAR